MEQVKFTYFPLGKAFEKQIKTIEDQGQKQIDALKSLESSDKQLPSIKDFTSKEKLNPEIIDEIERIEKEDEKVDRSQMVYKGYNKIYDFRKFKTIRGFGDEIRSNIINMHMANDEQNKLVKYIKEFKTKKTRKINLIKKKSKRGCSYKCNGTS